MWHQISNPLQNTFFSAFVAGIPIIVLFGLLLSRKVPGYIATLLTLFLALGIATMVYTMPLPLALLAGAYGILNGLFPIGWIVLNAVLLYNVSVKTGSFAIVRDSIETVTPDRRLQALLIAFCFGAFLEGAAGFGAPVAITAGMLVGLGFAPLYAAGICLIANTAPVAFGGIGIAVITAGHLTNIDPNVLSRMIGHQLPFIACIIPLWLVVIIAGWKGAREIWPAILVAGISYAVTMYLTASFLGPTLPDILSAIVSIICLMSLLKVWHPKTVWRFPKERETEIVMHTKHHNAGDLLRAWTPFVLLILFIGNWGSAGIQHVLHKLTILIPFGILDHAIITPTKTISVVYAFSWLSAAGTAILFATLITVILFRFSWAAFGETVIHTLKELGKPLVTIGSIVGFAYVANYSGMSTAMGNALTGTGYFFPFISPIIGWLGVFITGSDTSSNALFSNIQAQTARSLDVSPVLSVASNSSGGVAAKMISPQSIAVATASTKLTGQEGTLFRFTILHSIGLILIISTLAFVQAYYAQWMIPAEVSLGDASKASISMGEGIIFGVSVLCLLCLAIFSFRRNAVQE